MLRIFIVITILFVSGCSSNTIKYTPTAMSLSDAKDTVEELIMTQHQNWRPDFLEINDKYIAWDFGYVSKGSNSAVAIGGMPVIVGRSSSRSRKVGERFYYHSVLEVRLRPWQRKFKQWYTVALYGKNGVSRHVLRTKNLDDAKRFTDAMTSLLSFYR